MVNFDGISLLYNLIVTYQILSNYRCLPGPLPRTNCSSKSSSLSLGTRVKSIAVGLLVNNRRLLFCVVCRRNDNNER